MDIDDLIGTWRNKENNIIYIFTNNHKELVATFISGETNKPVQRKYYNNKESKEMPVLFDEYTGEISIVLWEECKFYNLDLEINFRRSEPEEYLLPCVTRRMEDNFLDQFYHLFEPYTEYKKETNQYLTTASSG